MWMRINKNISNNSKYRFIKKIITYYSFVLILMASFSMIFTPTVSSAETDFDVTIPPTTLYEGETYDYEVTIPEGEIIESILKYEWDWSYVQGQFNIEDSYETSDRNCVMSHTYNDHGDYNIQVRITTNAGEYYASGQVTILDKNPNTVLTILSDPPYYIDSEYTFDASGSASYPDEIVEYQWDWNYDGMTFNPSGDTGSIQSHSWNTVGSYTVAVQVIDDDGSYHIGYTYIYIEGTSPGPMITSTYPPDGSIIEITTPTIYATYESYESEIDTNNVVLSIDGNLVNTIANTEEVMYTPTYNLAYGNHKVTVEVPDMQGNRVIEEWFFTIVNPDDIHEESMGDIPAGVEVTVVPEDILSTCIDSLEIKPSIYLENTELTMIQLEKPPLNIPEPTFENDFIYQYLDITFTSNQDYVPDEYIDSALVKFRVDKSWIDDNKIDEYSMSLMRYHDSQWEKLPTNFLEDGDIYYLFESETPGFSTFAIVGTEILPIDPPYITDVPDVPWLVIIAITSIITLILMFVLFKARYIYLKDEQQEKNSKK